MPETDSATTESDVTALERSDASILFFDGVCGLCNRFVDYVIVRDTRGMILFAPLQGETAAARLTASDRERLDTVVFMSDGVVFRRSAAIVRVMFRLGVIWKVAAVLLWLIPWPLRDVGYRIVSSSRYRVFGKKDACRLPSVEERQRFLP